MNASQRNVKERLSSCRGEPAAACQGIYPNLWPPKPPRFWVQVSVTLGLFVRLHLYFMGPSASQLKTY
jgi:hypothetical protein